MNPYLKVIYRLLVCVFAAMSALCVDAEVKVTAKMDSAFLLMGKQTTINLETILSDAQASKLELLLPKDTLVTNVEIVEAKRIDSVSTNGLTTLRHQITIQSFDSGLYTIPPIIMAIGNDTALSNHMILKVVPVSVDSLGGKIHDYEGVADPGKSFFDFIPQSIYNILLWIVIVMVVCGVAAFVYLKYIHNRRNPFKPAVVIVPPYEEAMSALQTLKAEKLCEKGQEKEFYTRLTDILRHYLYRRFGISAMEMTSTEILRSLNEHSETQLTQKQMSEILSMADFVKFAKVRPLPDDNQKTYAHAVEFVEMTKPIELPKETQTSTNELKQ